MDAADGAVRRARLRRRELALDVLDGVVLQRNSRVAALLRAVVHEPLLADVEVARARAAAPVVRLAVGEVVLKAADAGVQVLHDLARAADRRRDLVEHLALRRSERLQMSRSVVDDPDRG